MWLATILANSLLSVVMIAICMTWIYLTLYLKKSYRLSPKLKDFDSASTGSIPKVSIILPARNEAMYISKCLDSLLVQDYLNYEIIAVNDSSSDETGDIISRYSKEHKNIVFIELGPRPEGWVGKNWACYQGYIRSTGDLLLFTDADTQHSPSLMSLAVKHFLLENLDAITAMPRLVCIDMWTRATLPMLSTFLHTRFSAIRVNDPETKVGYFFGSFFIISKTVYEKVGTHKEVKQELVEDGALGGKVKEAKFKLKMVRAEEEITAIWARDLRSLWQGLRRLMIPLYSQHSIKTSLMVIAIFFLLLVPFIMLPYSYLLLLTYGDPLSYILLITSTMTCVLIVLSNAVHCKFALRQSALYAIASPIAAVIISFSFISSIIDANKPGAVIWRNRRYTVKEPQNPLR
jgi:glycosyltransferase involved in cell wall biosynthesis